MVQTVPGQRLVGVPGPQRNQVDAQGQVSVRSLAMEVRDFHWKGLRSRRHRDLTSEKYLLHVDGEGGAQWLDLYHGTRLKIPANLSGAIRVQNNQERPILDNFVSHLTTQNYRFVVEASADRTSRESAIVDQALINYLVDVQHWNALMAEAKYMAACTGFCPIHSMWRDDMGTDPYEAVAATVITPDGPMPMQGPRPGFIDNWVGNPFDTVFDAGSRRNSVHRATYGRVLDAEMVRQAFGRPDLEGDDTMASASTFQRVARKWLMTSGNVHGSAVLINGQGGNGENIALIYDEIMPGVNSRVPRGSLRIIALQGQSGTHTEEGRGGNAEPILLWEGPLPAGVRSFVNIYSHGRGDDVLGKPFIGDIDDDQIQLNQLESMVSEYLRRASKPPLASTGKVNVETLSYRGDTVLEIEPLGAGSVELSYLEYPARHVNLLEAKINRVLDGMYRKGGWQAASRGEMKGSGKAIIALQQADDSIFGPISNRTKEEVEALARVNWRLCKEFMDVPVLLDTVGDELAHMVDSYVDRSMLSERAPRFKLVSGFGTSMEAKAQQLLNLFGMVDARGEQVLGTRELRRLWPDQSLFKMVDDPADVRARRPRVVNATIRQITKSLREMYPQLPYDLSHPALVQLAFQMLAMLDSMHPVLMDDDIEGHIESLSIITQDETEDPLARRIAILRQQQFWMWLAQKQAAMGGPAMAMPGGVPQNAAGNAPGQPQPSIQMSNMRPSTAAAFQPQTGGVNAQSMVNADQSFANRVRRG